VVQNSGLPDVTTNTRLTASFSGHLCKPAPQRLNQSGFNEARDDGGRSGISWTTCKSFAPRSRQIATSAPHQSIFTGRMLFMTPNQQRQSIEGKVSCCYDMD